MDIPNYSTNQIISILVFLLSLMYVFVSKVYVKEILYVKFKSIIYMYSFYVIIKVICYFGFNSNSLMQLQKNY